MPVLRVSGDVGSGKTTLCKKLSKILGYEHVYTGGIFREMAAQQGMSIETFYAALSANPELERSVDAKQEQLMLKRDHLIVEGRIAPFQKCNFPSVNLKVAVSQEEGVRRQLLRSENEGLSFEEMRARSNARIEQERAHYKTLYGIDDYLANRYFDIVFDTTHLDAEGVLRALLPILTQRLVSRY